MKRQVFLLFVLVCALPLLFAGPARAATYNVSSQSEWNAAMTAAFSTSEDDIVNITASFTLTADLRSIFSSMTINGNNHTINGADSHRAISLGASGASVTINNLTFSDNQAPANSSGGAILYEGGSALTLDNVTIRDSAVASSGNSRNGGGIHCTAANLTIRNSRIHDNSGVDGGGVYISSNCANARIINSSIYDNDSEGNGGGIHIWGGNAVNANAPSLTISNSRIYGNTAGTSTTVKDGGGIYARGTTIKSAALTISNSSIYNNLAYAEGGGMYFHGRTAVTMKRSAVYGNESKGTGDGGGGMMLRNEATTVAGYTIENSSIYGNRTAGRGAGISAKLNATAGITSVVSLRHVTISGNTTSSTSSTAGAGFYANNAKVNLQSSIIHGNKGSGGSADSNCIFDQIPASGGNAPTLSNNVVGAGSTSASAPQCTANADPADPLLDGPGVHGQGNFFIPRLGSAAIDSIGNADCLLEALGGREDQRGRARPYPAGGNCDKGAIEWYPPAPRQDDGAASGSSSGSSSGASSAAVGARVSTCLTLEGIAVYNAGPFTECQRVNAMQIANPSIVEGEFVDAVDVWSWVLPNTRVCFEAAGGGFKFIDTASMPRTVSDLEACSMGGLTCATINGIGQLALLPGEADASCAELRARPRAAPTAQPTASPTAIWARELSGCMVLTDYWLNVRDGPAGVVIGTVAHGAKLTALARTVGWFKVDNLGREGWIAAMFVTPEGACD